MNSMYRLRLAALFAAAGLPLGAYAQVAAPASQEAVTAPPQKQIPIETSTASPAEADTTVVLSPFEVTTAKDNGYAATETLAGTRLRTNLADIGGSISVYTAAFLNDIGAKDAGTLLQYTTNAQVGGALGTYTGLGNGASVDESGNLRSPQSAQRIRGLAAADNARDYYVTDIPFDTYNTDRIDILRGPNSLLYGLGSPAGIVNQSLAQAQFKNADSLDFQVDSWGSTRAALDINQQIIPGQLAIHLDALSDDRRYEQKQAFQNQKRIYGALRWDPQLFKSPSLHTSIKANIEHGTTSADRPRTVPPNDAFSAFWRSRTVSASNPFGGMGQASISNVYDPYRTDVSGGSYGALNSSTAGYQPYLSDVANQQQPVWFLNGATGQLYSAYGGYINNGAVNATGGFTGVSNGLVGKYQNGIDYVLSNLPAAAINYNLAGAQYGQYRNMSLLDPSVFNFYKNLIDGPSSHEWEHFTAGNVDISQTALNDHIGIDLSFDDQKYSNGANLLIGGSPTLTIDVTRNLANYFQTPGADGETSTTNPNYGRPVIVGAGNSGSGTSYDSTRKYLRASVFGELRGSDLNLNSFLTKLLGTQRLNGVAANEQYWTENRSWQDYANSQAWAGYWNGNSGATSAFTDRPPVALIYLGPSVVGRAGAAGSNVPGIQTNLGLASTGVNVFDTTWQGGTSYGSPYSVPSNLAAAFNSATAVTQASNPANYTGWNTGFTDNLISDLNGSNPNNLTLAQKALRETVSESGSYQGYFWNNAVVATLGWRYDEVKTKSVTALQNPANRTILNTDPSVYALPADFPAAQIVKGHSTSGSGVFHLNQFLPHDPLPFNVSLSYNESSNFQVTNTRVDVFGTPISNPTGKTYEYSTLLSTKDGKFSLRIGQYTTRIDNASAGIGSQNTLGSVISQGLRWRNVFLYHLGGYDLSTANQTSYRNTWTNAYPNETAAQAAAEEDAAITGWNNIQNHLQALGFFKAWGFTPTTSSALVNETTYLANPGAYAPDPSTVYAYAATAPQGFTVTANTESKGDEAEFTYNPLPNWRIAFNGAKTTAVRNDVGGPVIDSYVNYVTSQLINPDGTLTAAGKLPQFGSAASAIYPAIWGPFLANYQLLKLQEGAAVPELRKYRFNVITNYEFDHGVLKNVGFGGGYRWEDKVIVGYPVTAAGTFDLHNPYYGPSDGAVDLWATYHRPLVKGIQWSVRLSVRNALATDGLIPVSIEPDGKTWATVRTKPVQEFSLDNRFSF